ncbi:hypothetical protein ABZS96_20885 [Streptomyces avermitilis]
MRKSSQRDTNNGPRDKICMVRDSPLPAPRVRINLTGHKRSRVAQAG